MTIEFTEFVAPAPVLKAIQVTAANVEELAVWMGADTYSVEKTLVGGERVVTFKKEYQPDKYPGRLENIAVVKIGDYLIQIPEHTDGRLHTIWEKFAPVTEADIANFTLQQETKGHIDPESRADDKE